VGAARGGHLVILIGLAMLRSPKAGAAATVVVGLLLLVVPMVVSLPARAGDADQLNANLPVYTQALVDNATGALGTIGAIGAEMQSTMLPELATQLKMSPEQLQTFLGSNVPATAQELQTMPASMQRFNGLVKVFDNILSNYETLKPVGPERLILIMMGAGGLVAVLGGLTLVTARKR